MRILITAVALLFCAVGFSQNTTPNATLKLWFRDAERGTAVIPYSLLVNGKPVTRIPDPVGRIDVPVAPGDQEILVKARGYNEMKAKERAEVDNSPMNIVLLDPSEPPAELSAENLKKLIQPESSGLAGFVVDDQTCTPVEGVRVSVKNTTATTLANNAGFFGLTVPLVNAGPLPEQPSGGAKFTKVNVKLEKPGYGTEERRNILMMSNEPKKLQIRMVRGGAPNVLDEENDRGGLLQSTFGVYDAEHKDHDHDSLMHGEEDNETTSPR